MLGEGENWMTWINSVAREEFCCCQGVLVFKISLFAVKES